MKNKLIKILFLFAFALSTLCTFAVAGHDTVVIMQKPVKVIAKDINGSDTDHYQLELSIEYESDRFKFKTDMRQTPSFQEAIESQRMSTRWKGPYLLVGWERGGGNASRGNLDTVFMLNKGKLLYLGEVDADSFESEAFKDWYNKFESNKLTSHAESPVIRLVLEEKGKGLVVNLEKTWRENQKRFDHERAIIQELLNNKKLNRESLINKIAASLLFNAVLSKYCNRQADLDSIIKITKEVLDARNSKISNDILSLVIPGELPKPAVKVERY